MFHTRPCLSLRRAVAPELIRDQHPGHILAAFQQLTEACLRGLHIPPRLEEDAPHMPILIHGALEILACPIDR
jgi:hypothetical protein